MSSSAARTVQPTPPLAPQRVGASFLGGTLAESGFVPPDSMGTAGPTQFLVGINGLIRTFDKGGNPDGTLNTSMDSFFAPVLGPGNYTSDPRVRYDRLSGRWFITMITVNVSAGSLQPANRLLLAVSSGGTITSATSFTFFSFQQDSVAPTGIDAGCFLDYDTLGVDANALYVGGNFFCVQTVNGSQQVRYADSSAFVIRKTSVLGAGPIVVTAFRNLTNGRASGSFTPQGADNDEPSATTGYLIGIDVLLDGDLKLRRIIDPGGTPSISANIDIPVATTSDTIAVPHRGSDGRLLDSVDERLMNAIVRDGQIWTVHTIRVDSTGVGSPTGDRDGARWYQIGSLDTTPAVSQFGTVFDTAATNPNFFFMPSISVSRQGDMAMGGTVAGVSSFINAWTAGRLASDPPGTTEAPGVYTFTNLAYNPVFQNFPDDPHRWGDYSFTSVDPNDGMTMWTIQEHTDATNSWGVTVARLMALPPASASITIPSGIPTGQPSVNVTVIGTSEIAGLGFFFDPGSGFPNRLHATVSNDLVGSGSVTVNSVVYEGPLKLLLNLNTVAATAGSYDITVTNPDGQSLGRTGALFIFPAMGLLRVTTNPPVPSQLSLDDGPTAGQFEADSWGINWLTLPAGTYNLVATHVEGFTEPAAQQVTVTANATTTVQENFVQRGELRVVTSPAVPAPISVDGITREDWGMFTDLPAGTHNVCFGPAAGFDPPTPACRTVTLTAGQLSTITGTYTSNPQATGTSGTGLLRVTTNPALPSQILVNGIPMDSFGLNWVDLAPGQYTVSFTHVEGWTEPAPQVVTVVAGQTSTLQGDFTQRGELRVISSPPVPAAIRVDDTLRDSFGLFTDLPVGQHIVCFGWAPSEVAPPCQQVPVIAGQLTKVTGIYTAGP